MTASSRTILSLSKTASLELRKQCTRTLYTAESLGVDKYKEQRERTAIQYSGVLMVEKFKSKLRDLVLSDSKNPVFIDDFKSFIHLASGSQEDVDTILRLCKKYEDARKTLRFSNFTFGPIIMRYFHLHGKPAEALQAFIDPDNLGLFHQFTTFRILMDLLFEKGMYNEVLGIFDVVKELKVGGYAYHKTCTTLALAACYKLNTPGSYKRGLQIFDEVVNAGGVLTRRTNVFLAALAINQNDPLKAIEILTGDFTAYVTVFNTRVLALSKLDRPEDAFPVIRQVLKRDGNSQILSEVLSEVEKSIERVPEVELKAELEKEFSKVKKALTEAKRISGSPMDDILFLPIDIQPPERNPKLFDVGNQSEPYERRSFSTRRKTNMHDFE